MPNVSIISPDPELRRMLGLTLELKGASVKTHVNADFRGKDPTLADAVVIDLAGLEHPLWKDSLAFATNSRAKTVVILPRGHRAAQKDAALARANLIVQRPFELMDIAEKIVLLSKKCGRHLNKSLSSNPV